VKAGKKKAALGAKEPAANLRRAFRS
jgi:hypothetical protein